VGSLHRCVAGCRCDCERRLRAAACSGGLQACSGVAVPEAGHHHGAHGTQYKPPALENSSFAHVLRPLRKRLRAQRCCRRSRPHHTGPSLTPSAPPPPRTPSAPACRLLHRAVRLLLPQAAQAVRFRRPPGHLRHPRHRRDGRECADRPVRRQPVLRFGRWLLLRQRGATGQAVRRHLRDHRLRFNRHEHHLRRAVGAGQVSAASVRQAAAAR